MLHGASQKSKRISHSTSHAESLATAKVLPVGQLTSLRLYEPQLCLKYGKMTPLNFLQYLDSITTLDIPHDHYVDCMDLWELGCGSRGVPQDKSQRLCILALREERRSQRLRRLIHVTTHFMLCDKLTKHTGYVSKSLEEIITSGHWTIQGKLRVRQHFGKRTDDTFKDDGTFYAINDTDEFCIGNYLDRSKHGQKQDFWMNSSNFWFRVHLIPRTALFTPTDVSDGPDVSSLTYDRFILGAHLDPPKKMFNISDQWSGSDPHGALTRRWIGLTRFTIRP